MAIKRRLVILGPAEETHPEMGIIELGDQQNANEQYPLRIVLQQECDLGGWHNVEPVKLPSWPSEM
jgi:hypothetical protein